MRNNKTRAARAAEPDASLASEPETPPGGAVAAVVLTVLVFGAAIGGLALLWRHLAPQVQRSGPYQLHIESITISPQPAWVRSDVTEEVFRSGSLQSLSLLDEKLVERVADAFALHPWVERVVGVSKRYPSQIDVQLVYRRPVGMVEVDGGLLPVDGEGVVLPHADFSPVESNSYPRLGGLKSGPRGPVGTPWGDATVHEGARLAKTLAGAWDRLGLQLFLPTEGTTASTARREFELVTKSGQRIAWGHAPGSETDKEPAASAKLAALERHVTRHGSLDGFALDLGQPLPVEKSQ